ncbi:MAG: dihydrouridine synthase [Rhodocyclaceae bacterium]|nr:dihydrouridine synthase [Rhodocyclaceae bacterium]
MSRILLAPMEGLADDVLRDVLTRAGGYDCCFTEFIRVTTTLLPASSFTRVCPELLKGAKTAAGTSVRVQLLGSAPSLLAENAARLAELQPAGIDLNFGCPTPLVNRNRGGAALLDEPELLQRIIQAVRRAVPATIPVTAKMRLGISDTGRALECALALEAGGVSELAVHGRTRDDGYRPPARWEWIGRIRQTVKVPLIANGEVWSAADYRAIRDATGCADVMLGRGAVADPLLACRLKEGGEAPSADDWSILAGMIAMFWERVQEKVMPHQSPGRLKQWLGLLQRNYPEADRLYRDIRELRHATEVGRTLAGHGVSAGCPTRV